MIAMKEKSLEDKLYEYGVYNAWQFIKNTRKTLHTVAFCKNTIIALIAQMEEEHAEWQDNLWRQLFEQEGPEKSISIRSGDMPVHNLSIAGVEVDTIFLLDKLTKDFFQYCRNAFDSMAQVANAGCLAFNEKEVDEVDFRRMLKVFQQQTYSTDFPVMAAWFDKINGSDEFKYLDAFCNRTKHTCDVYLKVSMAIMGRENETTINPFFRMETQHERQNVKDYLTAIHDFVDKAFEDFILALEKEIPKRLYVENRYHTLNCYQQIMKDNENSNFSVIFITEDADGIEKMPGEIEVLLLRQLDGGEIAKKNCDIDTIYVCAESDKNKYVGKYEATELCGDDTLIRYRRYKKAVVDPIKNTLFFEIFDEWRKKKVFYHRNHFMNITTVTDMDEFAGRVQLPF